MVLFQDCWASRRSTLTLLQHLLDDAEANKATERRAAVAIQRIFRGQFVRAMIATQRRAEIVIARVFRGHLGRRRYRHLHILDQQRKRTCVLHYYAAVIQKVVRGAWSRRVRLDFRVRKAFVAEIAAKGDAMRCLLQANLREQQLNEQRTIAAAAAHELVTVTQDLHHLVSTRSIAGVYNARMQRAGPATARGVPVETLIRTNARALVAQQLAQAPRPVTLKPFPPSLKATVQAASVYDVDTQANRKQQRFAKLRRVGTRDFFAVHNAAQDDLRKRTSAISVHASTSYLDDWANPYKKRGVPRTKTDLLPTLSTLARAPTVPFHLTHGGNKSKVLPNDRFDV